MLYTSCTTEAPPEWKEPEARERRSPRGMLSELAGSDMLRLAGLSGGRADLGMLSAALEGLQTDLQEHLLERTRVETTRAVQETEQSDINCNQPLHETITCDECKKDGIRGHRYKCG